MVLERRPGLGRLEGAGGSEAEQGWRERAVTFALICSELTCETDFLVRWKEKRLGKTRGQKGCMTLASHLIL